MLILTTKRDVTSSVLHNFGAENKRYVRVAHISFCSVLSARSALGAPALQLQIRLTEKLSLTSTVKSTLFNEHKCS